MIIKENKIMCKCFDDTKEKIVEKIKETLPEHTEFDGRWKNRVFFFGENPPTIPVIIPFEYFYREVKVDGSPYKKMTNSIMNVTMSYCPLCGVKS